MLGLEEHLEWIERESREWKEFVEAGNKALKDSIAASQAEMMETLNWLLKEKRPTKL